MARPRIGMHGMVYGTGVAYERAKASAKAADENKSCSRGDASARVLVIVNVGPVVWPEHQHRARGGEPKGEGAQESRRTYPS